MIYTPYGDDNIIDLYRDKEDEEEMSNDTFKNEKSISKYEKEIPIEKQKTRITLDEKKPQTSILNSQNDNINISHEIKENEMNYKI